MSEPVMLNTLPPGDSAMIIAVENENRMAARLRDLGFSPQTKVESLFRSASGDPTAYRIRETVIALRSDDSKWILVQPDKEG